MLVPESDQEITADDELEEEEDEQQETDTQATEDISAQALKLLPQICLVRIVT